MKPHPRIRKTIKWGGAVVTVLMVVVWIGSGWRHGMWFDASGNMLHIANGGLSIAVRGSGPGAQPYPVPWEAGFPTAWQVSWGTYGVYRIVSFPLWLAALLSLLVTIAAWRCDTLARRRARLNLCRKCGYDRSGLAKDAKCPECGTVSASV